MADLEKTLPPQASNLPPDQMTATGPEPDWKSVAEELAEGIRRLQDDVVGEYGMSATSDFVVRRTAPLLERFDSFRGVSDD